MFREEPEMPTNMIKQEISGIRINQNKCAPKFSERICFLWISQPNNALSASSTFFTGTNSMLNLFVFSPCMLLVGIIIWLKPSFSASATRCSIRLTGLTSPLRPTSPAMHQPLSMAVSTLLDNTAEMILRSIAKSVTRKPPAIFMNTSF